MSSLTMTFSDHHGPIATVVLDHPTAERLGALVANDEDLAIPLGVVLADWRSSEPEPPPA